MTQLLEDSEIIQIKILNNNIPLDSICWNCCIESDSWGDDYPPRISALKDEFKNGERCHVCSNTRFLLTKAGESIMELIARHNKTK